MRVSTSLSWIEPRQVEINLSIVAKTHDASLLLIIKTLSRTCHSSKFPSRHHQQRKLMEITRNEQKITTTQGDSPNFPASFEMTLTLALVNRGFVWLTLTRRYKINMYMESKTIHRHDLQILLCTHLCIQNFMQICYSNRIFRLSLYTDSQLYIFVCNCNVVCILYVEMTSLKLADTVRSLYMYVYLAISRDNGQKSVSLNESDNKMRKTNDLNDNNHSRAERRKYNAKNA